MLTGWFPGVPAASAQSGPSLPTPIAGTPVVQAKIDPAVRASLAALSPVAQITVIVTMQEQAGLVNSAGGGDLSLIHI